MSFLSSKVGIVGSAASAVQIAPAIADKVATLTVFQRTPNWYFPKFDPVYPDSVKEVFRKFPFVMTVQRLLFFLLVEAWSLVWLHKEGRTFLTLCRRGDRRLERMMSDGKYLQSPSSQKSGVQGWLSDMFQKVIESGMRQQAGGDEALAAKVTPSYKLGCKRILLTSDFVPLFTRDNCRLVTDPILRITETGVTTSTEHIQLDTIVYATGFDIEASLPEALS